MTTGGAADGAADDTADDKAALRRRMRAARVGIPDRGSRSTVLVERVLEACEAHASRSGVARLHVLVFVGVGSEPSVDGLIAGLRASGHITSAPRVEGERMVAVPVVDRDDLTLGAFGIPEPSGDAVDPSDVDIVIVPGLAFTRDGRRLGQGGGFYDRFLPLVRHDCLTIGVGFVEQLVADLPTEPHDRILSMVITDAVRE